MIPLQDLPQIPSHDPEGGRTPLAFTTQPSLVFKAQTINNTKSTAYFKYDYRPSDKLVLSDRKELERE